MSTHTLSVLVQNRPGILARVAALFSRRGFNVESLAVGPTEDPAVSRMTIVVDCAKHPLEQVTKQLDKLILVLEIVELDPAGAVERELALIKVRALPEVRPQLQALAEAFRARIVDVGAESMTLEVTGRADKLTALLELLAPYGIRELARSGRIGLLRGDQRTGEQHLELLSA